MLGITPIVQHLSSLVTNKEEFNTLRPFICQEKQELSVQSKLSESVKTNFDASILNRTKLLLHPHPHIQNLVSIPQVPSYILLD